MTEIFILCGVAGSSDGDVGDEVSLQSIWLLKVDAAGNIIWSKTYGGSSQEIGYDIQKSYDGNYYVCGNTSSSDGDMQENNGSYDAYIMKIDTAGSIIWLNTLGTSSGDFFNSILPTKDGGVICAGGWNGTWANWGNPHQSNDMLVARYSKDGELLWQQTYGGDEGEVSRKILEAEDNGYFIIGNSKSNDGDIINNYGNYDGIVVKLTPDSIYTHNSDISDDTFMLYSTRSTLTYINEEFKDLICGNYSEVSLNIENTGEFELTIDSTRMEGVNKDNFQLEYSLDKEVVEAGDNLEIRIIFNADEVSNYEAQLNIYNDSRNKPVISIPFSFTKDSVGVEYSQSSIVFDEVKQNTLETQSFNITNTGSLPFEFDIPTIINNFELISVIPNPIPAGQTGVAEITFLSDKPGEYIDTLRILDTCSLEYELELKANVRYNAKIEHEISEFKDLLCETEYEVPLRIRNEGIENLVIESAGFAGDDTDDFALEFQLNEEIIPAGYFLDVNVLFQPTSAGVKTAELVIYSNAGNEPELHIPLQAKKDSIGLTFMETPVVFDNLSLDTPDSKTVEIMNTGTVELEFNLPFVINNFEVRNVSPNPVPAAETAQLEIHFAGDVAGNYNEDYIYTDICNSEHILKLEAYVYDNSSDIAVQFSGFNDLVCEYTETKELTLKNLSNTDIEIYSASIEGTNKDEFILEDALSNETIASGEYLKTEVTFKPKSVGTKIAYLLIENSSTETPELKVEFEAKKDTVSLTFSTDRVEFLNLEEYETASEKIEIINTGTTTVTLPDSFTYNEFEIRNISKNPLLPDETAEAEVYFSGATAGEYEETAIIPDICLRTFEIELFAQVNESSGEGKLIKYTEKSGFQDILCKKTSLSEIEISNTGDVDLVIEEAYISGDDASSFSLDDNYNNKTLKQGEKIAINITFTPEFTGLANAVLNIKNNSENNPEMEIPLSAKKDSTSLIISETDIYLTLLATNQEDTQFISITNAGTTEILLEDSYQINEFIISNINPNPIPAKTDAQAEVKFTGGVAGEYSEIFELEDLCGRVYEINTSASVQNIDPPVITLKVLDASGVADETVTLFAEIEDAANLELNEFTISGDLYFDHNLIESTEHTMTQIDANTSYIHLEEITAQKEIQFPLAYFVVKQSENSSCVLELKDIETDETLQINTKSGTFTLLKKEGTSRIKIVNPNPAVDEVAITFYSGEQGRVELKLVNSIGQHIRTIYKGENTKGSYHDVNISTSTLASGVYYLILNAPDGTVTKKIVILE
jgi:hypothetical protein